MRSGQLKDSDNLSIWTKITCIMRKIFLTTNPTDQQYTMPRRSIRRRSGSDEDISSWWWRFSVSFQHQLDRAAISLVIFSHLRTLQRVRAAHQSLSSDCRYDRAAKCHNERHNRDASALLSLVGSREGICVELILLRVFVHSGDWRRAGSENWRKFGEMRSFACCLSSTWLKQFFFTWSQLFGIGVGATAVLTLLTPPAANWSLGALIAVRIIEGLFEGVTYSSLYEMWSKWVSIMWSDSRQ